MTPNHFRHFAQCVFVLFSLTSSLVLAQSGAGLGNISGLVQDASGAAVPDAMVLVTNESKGIRRTLETTSQGQFLAPALIPDSGYKVTVTKSGFATYEATNIAVAVGQNVDLRVTMSVSATTTTVDVTAVGVGVETSKTDVSQVVGQTQILELPINGRRVDSFVLLTPAVVPDGAFGLLSFRGIAGHNSFLTDGNDTTNQYYNESAGRTRIQSQISQEAVQEFQVVSNNFAAEYGNAMGGVVNTITKSGSNSIHGTGYWFFRNRSLNARDRYASFNPTDTRHQSGASIGGPIKKDKLFYFFNYEATRRNFPAIASVITPNLFTATGALNTAANPCTASAAQCSAAINLLTTRNFGVVPRTLTQDLGFGRIDYQMSERDSLSFSLSMLRWVSPNGIQSTGIVFNTGNAIGNNADSTVRNAFGRAQWTHIASSNMLNEARFGWFKDRLFDDAAATFLFPGIGRAQLIVNGTGNLGVATAYPRLNPSENRFQFSDNVSLTKGAHTMKFGVDFAATRDYQSNLDTQFGSYTYATLTAFALDFSGNTAGAKNWTQYQQRFGNPVVDTTMKTIGFYGQDQYRITPRLLFNYGVRYDYTVMPQPQLVNPDYPATGKIPSATDNIAPRAGISYSLTNDQKTVLRAGYGIFYARYQSGLINSLFKNNSVYQKFITFTAAQAAVGPVYPNFLPSTTFSPPAGTLDIMVADLNMKNPYTHQGNVSIERQLNSTTSFTVSYLWSRGVRLYGVRDLNIGPLGAPITYRILDVAGNQEGTYTTPTYRTPRPDPRYRGVRQVENPGLSYYNGMTVQVNRRFARGFQGSASYTWSHAIDLNQGTANNNLFFDAGPTSFINGNFAAEKGSSANDVRHRAVFSFVYTPTFTRSNSAFARFVINNWQISQVTTLQSAQPTNSTVNVSGSAFTGALVTGTLNGCGCATISGTTTRVPFLPVNNLDLDRIYKVDARLAKKLPFNERFTGYLQFEAFNVFNTPYDTGRLTGMYTLNAAALTLSRVASYGLGNSSASSPDGSTARRAQVSLRVTF